MICDDTTSHRRCLSDELRIDFDLLDGAELARDRTALLRGVGELFELRLVDAGHVDLGLEADLRDRESGIQLV